MNRYCGKKVVDLYVIGTIEMLIQNRTFLKFDFLIYFYIKI